MPLILDGSAGVTQPTWTTATRPSNPSAGQMGFNSTTGLIDVYTSSGWKSVTNYDTIINNTGYFSIPIGTTAQRPASPPNGAMRINISTNGTQTLEVYNSTTSQWIAVKAIYTVIDGLTTATAGASANDLMIRNSYTSANNGLYYITNYGSITATQHYCLFDTTYAGGGWTLLMTQTSGNNFAAGSNYAFSVTTGTPSRSAAYGLDRRNTFIPVSGDEFMIIREATGEWVRFVVTTWSPTANQVANRWETLNNTSGTNNGHPYWAVGQTYGSNGSALSGFIHFNGCAIGGNCGSGGGDGAGFGTNESYLFGTSGASAYGGGYNSVGNGGSPLYWGTTSVEGTALTYWFRRSGT